MPITAKFIADFSQFTSETELAEAALARFGGAADDGTVKMRNMERWSDGAAKRLKDLEGSGRGTAVSIQDLGGALGQFDGILGALGIHIGSEIKAVGELGAASGKTATDIGLVGTAGLLAGAALAGWGIGRVVADFFDLDKAIGDSVAALLGWGDVTAQAAGAAEDLHNHIMAVGTGISTWKSLAAQSTAVTDAWRAELAKMPLDLEQLTKDLDSQNYSVQQLHDKYHLSVEAIQFFARETKKAADAEQAAGDVIHASNARQLKDLQTHIDAMAPFHAAMEELNATGKGWQGTLDTIDGTVVEGIKYYLAAGVSLSALAKAYGLTDAQVKAVSSSMQADKTAADELTASQLKLAEAQKVAATEAEAHTAALLQQKKAAEAAAAAAAALAAANRAMGGSTQYDLTTAEGRAKVPDDVRMYLHDGFSFEQAMRLSYAMKMGFDVSNDPLFRIKGPRVPGFAGGVQNFSGGLAMVGERGPELVNLPSGSDVIPFGRGGGVVVHNTFNIVDTEAGIARRVSDQIMRAVMRGKKLGRA